PQLKGAGHRRSGRESALPRHRRPNRHPQPPATGCHRPGPSRGSNPPPPRNPRPPRPPNPAGVRPATKGTGAASCPSISSGPSGGEGNPGVKAKFRVRRLDQLPLPGSDGGDAVADIPPGGGLGEAQVVPVVAPLG